MGAIKVDVHIYGGYTPTKTNYALNFYGKVWEWWLAWSCHLGTFISRFSFWSTVGRVHRPIPNYTNDDLWMLPLFSSIYEISWVAVEACRSCLCTSYFVPFRALDCKCNVHFVFTGVLEDFEGSTDALSEAVEISWVAVEACRSCRCTSYFVPFRAF